MNHTNKQIKTTTLATERYIQLTLFDTEKATLFCTDFIKYISLGNASKSHWRLVVKTAMDSMIVPPMDILFCFDGQFFQ